MAQALCHGWLKHYGSSIIYQYLLYLHIHCGWLKHYGSSIMAQALWLKHYVMGGSSIMAQALFTCQDPHLKTRILLRPRVQTDRGQGDRVQTDRVQTDRVQKDRVQTDRVQTDRVQTDRVQTDRVLTDRVLTDRSRQTGSRQTGSKAHTRALANLRWFVQPPTMVRTRAHIDDFVAVGWFFSRVCFLSK
jgi:hypothetical protein